MLPLPEPSWSRPEEQSWSLLTKNSTEVRAREEWVWEQEPGEQGAAEEEERIQNHQREESKMTNRHQTRSRCLAKWSGSRRWRGCRHWGQTTNR